MAQAEEELPSGTRRRRWPIALAALAVLLVLALLGAWLARERIAGSVIAGQLETFGLPATYKIVSVGPRRQVLRDVVVGDPSRPDLTAERIETELVPRFGAPRGAQRHAGAAAALRQLPRRQAQLRQPRQSTVRA